jgi:hypothetical protein
MPAAHYHATVARDDELVRAATATVEYAAGAHGRAIRGQSSWTPPVQGAPAELTGAANSASFVRCPGAGRNPGKYLVLWVP